MADLLGNTNCALSEFNIILSIAIFHNNKNCEDIFAAIAVFVNSRGVAEKRSLGVGWQIRKHRWGLDEKSVVKNGFPLDGGLMGFRVTMEEEFST